jgi:hypothetical protein
MRVDLIWASQPIEACLANELRCYLPPDYSGLMGESRNVYIWRIPWGHLLYIRSAGSSLSDLRLIPRRQFHIARHTRVNTRPGIPSGKM